MPTAQRTDALDGLRGLAALGIVVLHAFMFTTQDTYGRGGLVRSAVGELRLGLVLFFVLSGYLLARPWIGAALERRPPPRLGPYALRRIARIGPAYWAAMLGSFWLLAGSGRREEIAASDLPIFAVFGQNYVERTVNTLDPPMWSLVVEVSFYVLLPLVGWLLLRGARGRAMLVAGAALLALAGIAWSGLALALDWPRTAVSTLPTFLPVFACGIAAAALTSGVRPGRAACAGLALGGLALVLADGAWHSQGTGAAGQVLRDLPAAAGFAAIVAAVAARPPRLLGSAPLRGLGTISYGVYLWHVPAIIWLREHELLAPDDFAGAIVRILSVAIALGTLSWLFVERPAINAVAGRLRRRAPTGRARRAEPAASPA